VTSATDHTAVGGRHQRAALVSGLGISVSDALLIQALTHRSYAYENGGLPTNERLEFLGDAVLGLVVTDALYRHYPARSEGQLAKNRSGVVSAAALADVARDLGVGPALLLGHGEELTGGRQKASILADALEAVIGAVYLEHGFDVAVQVVMGLVATRLDSAAARRAGTDWKTDLQELVAATGREGPQYRVTGRGPDHAREFTAEVLLDAVVVGQGHGRSKKQAEQRAAEQACLALRGTADAGAPATERG
jgi:ribonuclease-3